LNMRIAERQFLSINLLGIFLVGLSVSHWFPLGINVLELLSAFAHFTLGISLLVLLISLLFRKWFLLICSILASILCGVLVVPQLSSLNAAGDKNFTIGQFNIYHHNPSPKKAIQELIESDVDVFTIQEMNSDWSSIIDSTLKKKYSFSIEKPWDECCYGIGFYSKYPIIESRIFNLETTPAIRATIDVNGKVITIISFHTKPPAFPDETEERNIQLQKIATMASKVKGPLIVLGDWNIVPWDATFKSFLNSGNLSAVRDGFQATYPMELGFPLIPIDHISFSESLIPTSCQTISISGSDHGGLVAGFAFKD